MSGLNNIFNSIIGGGVNKKSRDGETKLLHAVRQGNKSQVKKLLKQGADPNIKNDHGITPLHEAAWWGEGAILELLLAAGANPNIDTGKGWTPLHSAALSGGMKSRAAIIDKLKKAGAKDDVADKNGWTAKDYMALWDANAEAALKLRSQMTAQTAQLCTRHQTGSDSPSPCGKCGPRAPKH